MRSAALKIFYIYKEFEIGVSYPIGVLYAKNKTAAAKQARKHFDIPGKFFAHEENELPSQEVKELMEQYLLQAQIHSEK